jgi:hypothetical protein
MQVGIKGQILNQLYYQASNISMKLEIITMLASSEISRRNSK